MSGVKEPSIDSGGGEKVKVIAAGADNPHEDFADLVEFVRN